MSALTRETAAALFDSLVANKIAVSLSYRHHPKLTPSDGWQVTCPIGPGRLDAAELRKIQEIAVEHGCDVHFIGSGSLVIFPTPQFPVT